ncbi:alkene reductase [Pseudonocardia sp. CA-107938]|uniref:alkene reductase n=1 Tax=Pseudonocardia sp. CA-107938 TaxID=3240021 RepID=UPI003D90F98F
MTNLFAPVRMGDLDLPHRLVMAPVTRNRATADGVPTPMMAAYYAERASAALLIVEATTPSAVGQTYPNIPGIHSAAQVQGWRAVTDAVRAAGGHAFVQLQHGGRVGHPATSGLVPVAPSAVALPETLRTPLGERPAPVPHALTEDGIRLTIGEFVTAACNAIDAGFEGVEVHGANGHLLHQFLAGAATNRRTDGYGGSVAGRIRFVVETVAAVAEAIGPQRVGLRISPGSTVNSIREDEPEELYRALLGALDPGLAYVHVVFADRDERLYRLVRDTWPGLLVANPGVDLSDPVPADGGLAAAERLLGAGADVIAVGRAFVANPDLVARLRSGAPLNPVRDEYFYTGGERGYLDYPHPRRSYDGSVGRKVHLIEQRY